MTFIYKLGSALLLSLLFSFGSLPARAADIVETAAANSQFKVFTLAVKVAGLADLLKGKGPFTVFAPSDAAFAKLPAGMVESLLKAENKAMLRSILEFHILPDRALKAARIVEVGNFDIDTLEGSTAEIDIKSGPSIENAQIILADIAADNGVIHMIDAVILPLSVKRKIRRAARKR